jgi:hypothetical protein
VSLSHTHTRINTHVGSKGCTSRSDSDEQGDRRAQIRRVLGGGIGKADERSDFFGKSVKSSIFTLFGTFWSKMAKFWESRWVWEALIGKSDERHDPGWVVSLSVKRHTRVGWVGGRRGRHTREERPSWRGSLATWTPADGVDGGA